MKIDLHTHTTASDGILSPSQLIELAVKKKLTHLSVTDHDAVAALSEIEKLTAENGIEFIPGIEISCSCEEEEIHLLAYHIQYQDPDFLNFLSQFSEDRFSRLVKMIEKLNELNVKISLDDLKPYLKNEVSPGRPHLAQALVRLGYVANLKEAFRFYLDRGKPAYISRKTMEASEVISELFKNGAVPVLAHPGLIRNFEAVFSKLLESKLSGIEVYHPSHSRQQKERFLKLAIENRLIVTGGSDFHGIEKNKKALGSVSVPPEAILKLKQAAEQIRNLSNL